MFYESGIIYKSTIVDGVCHGFSTRLGGVSKAAHVASMNLGFERGDSREEVLENYSILAREISGGKCSEADVVITSQIHSAKVRILAAENRGEGITREIGESCDGFVTDARGVMPIIRVADCTPILLCGTKEDASPVIGAVHAGWRGSASGIAAEAVGKMRELGCVTESIKVAIGAHIGFCCYEVGEDFIESVRGLCGADFASRHIRRVEAGSYHADLTGMNVEFLVSAGILRENIDISPECTMCDPGKYHSHRATRGLRGTMGAGIVIL